MQFTEEEYAETIRKATGQDKVLIAAAWMEDTGTEVNIDTMAGVTGMEREEVARHLAALEETGSLEEQSDE